MKHIVVKKLKVNFENHVAIQDIDLEVEKGEFVAIVGKSGSGKSTLLHALANFISSSGEMIVPKSLGVVFQNYAVFPWLTVSENIGFGLSDKKDNSKIIADHLRLVELAHKKDVYPAELSGGQVQRVALARALAYDPEVLFMDEPYGALDVYTRDKMQEWLLDVWSKYKKTVLFVTHNIEEALFLADRVLVLTPTGFSKDYKVPFARPRMEDIKYSEEFNRLKREIYKAIG